MTDRADSADPLGDDRHFLNGTPLTKPLKSPELGDMKLRIRHITVLIQMNDDFTVAFNAGDRIN